MHLSWVETGAISPTKADSGLAETDGIGPLMGVDGLEVNEEWLQHWTGLLEMVFQMIPLVTSLAILSLPSLPSPLLPLLAIIDILLTLSSFNLRLVNISFVNRFEDDLQLWLLFDTVIFGFIYVFSVAAVFLSLILDIFSVCRSSDSEKSEPSPKTTFTPTLCHLLVPATLTSGLVIYSLLPTLTHCSLRDLRIHCRTSQTPVTLLLSLVTNPLKFPLTLLCCLPCLALLARSQALFKSQNNRCLTWVRFWPEGARGLAWVVFIGLYGLFLCDLFIFTSNEEEVGGLLVGEEGEVITDLTTCWRRVMASVIRLVVALCLHHNGSLKSDNIQA